MDIKHTFITSLSKKVKIQTDIFFCYKHSSLCRSAGARYTVKIIKFIIFLYRRRVTSRPHISYSSIVFKDCLSWETFRIKRKQNLGHILNRGGVLSIDVLKWPNIPLSRSYLLNLHKYITYPTCFKDFLGG